ncbi:MAG TPA: hypothetical protein VGM64_18330 [Lacunisphaera sp.]|jgi:hypothetical protein
MQETALFFHQLEWPAPETRVAGPVVWLRGWVVAKPGYNFVDVRTTGSTGVHLGVLGLPRTDLAPHFKSRRRWLPAEYIIGVALPDGPAEVAVEAMDESGNWHRLQNLVVNVAADGATSARVDGDVLNRAGGSSTRRGPHLPFHGHLDEDETPAAVRDGRIGLFGWLLHETQAVRRVFATFDGRVFNALESGLTDESLAEKVPQLPAARHARLRGGVDAPPTLFSPSCLRVYAELADGSVHLCFARRINLPAEIVAKPAPAASTAPRAEGNGLPTLPSGRPRRLLAVVRSLQPDDATLRALDVVRHLVATTQWAVRILASEDGPLHTTFEAAECPVQIVDPRGFFAATSSEEAAEALRKIGRDIWWRHLDGVALFDFDSTWASQLAAKNGVPVFHDPGESLAWAAPTALFRADSNAEFIAPIRGLAAHGAGVLLHAAAQLSERSLTRPIYVADVRGTTEESLFRASQQLNPGLSHLWSRSDPAAVGGGTTAGSPWLQAIASGGTLAAGALICPVFDGHPHRALLSGLATEMPVVTTPSPLLSAAFGANEVTFVPCGNPLVLANAITDLLGNPVARERRTAAAGRIVHDQFSPSRQLPRWRALMEAAFGA